MSLKIENIINSATSLAPISEIVEKANPEISWLGSCYISANGYQGTIAINALVFRVIEMVEKNPHFSEQERAYGKKIAKHFDRICEQSDFQIKHVNCFTWILIAIRSVFERTCFYGYNPVFEWMEKGEHELFDLYTAKQYVNVFGVMPPEEGRADILQTGLPDRWRHPEIRPNPKYLVKV